MRQIERLKGTKSTRILLQLFPSNRVVTIREFDLSSQRQLMSLWLSRNRFTGCTATKEAGREMNQHHPTCEPQLIRLELDYLPQNRPCIRAMWRVVNLSSDGGDYLDVLTLTNYCGYMSRYVCSGRIVDARIAQHCRILVSTSSDLSSDQSSDSSNGFEIVDLTGGMERVNCRFSSPEYSAKTTESSLIQRSPVERSVHSCFALSRSNESVITILEFRTEIRTSADESVIKPPQKTLTAKERFALVKEKVR